MNMSQVVTVCKELGISPQPGPLGVKIGTTGWRIECGGGIAGNAGDWWVRVIAGVYGTTAPDASALPLGPIGTANELRAILRKKWPSLQAPECGCGCGAPAGTCKFAEARLQADDLCVCGHAKKWHGPLPFVGPCHSGLRPCAGKCSSYIKAPSADQPGFMAPSERRRSADRPECHLCGKPASCFGNYDEGGPQLLPRL